MPAVSQVGKLPGGGDFGLKQRKHAVTGGRIANAIPYVAMAPPYTNGTFDSIAASLIRKRVSRLSVPSTTTSTPFRISRTVAEWTSLETGSIWISEFTERRRAAAASAFGRSTSRSAYSSCRWRFVSSTTSRSTSRRCPTPARARRSDEMLPRAPNPTTTARAPASLRWPSTPISGRTSWRRYRLGGRTVGERGRAAYGLSPAATGWTTPKSPTPQPENFSQMVGSSRPGRGTRRVPSGTCAAPPAPPAAVANSIAPAAPTSITSPAILPLTARLPMFRLDLAAAEFGGGDGQLQVRVIGGEFSPLRSLVTRAIELAAAYLEGPTADGTAGFHDPEIPFGGRQLHGRFDLNHLGANDVSESVHVVNVLGVLLRHVRDVNRPLRLAADLAGPSMDRGNRRGRHHPTNVVDHPVHDVPDLEFRGRVECPHPRDAVLRVQDEDTGRRRKDESVPLVRPLAGLEFLRDGNLVARQDHLRFHLVQRLLRIGRLRGATRRRPARVPRSGVRFRPPSDRSPNPSPDRRREASRQSRARRSRTRGPPPNGPRHRPAPKRGTRPRRRCRRASDIAP